MHVTFVTSAFQRPEIADFPGVRRYSTELVTALERNGISIRVVTPARSEDGGPVPGNIDVVKLREAWNWLGRTGNAAQARVLDFARRLARNATLFEGTDVVHTTVPLLSIDSIRNHCPVVAMVHHVERIRSPQDLMNVPFGNAYGGYTYRRADAIVTPSEATASRVTRLYGVNRRKVHVIYHGINTAKFFPDRPRESKTQTSEQRKILFVGPMNARKNVILLLEAFHELVRMRHDAKLVLVGSGPLDRRIKRFVRRPSLRGRVIQLRHVDDSTLRRLYSSADVFASPSVDEGFGLSVVEAMGCRTPVVVQDTPISREVVGDAGLLVAEASRKAWCEALSSVLDDSQVAESLAERGYRRVTEMFSWDIAAKKHIQLYTGLMKARCSEPG